MSSNYSNFPSDPDDSGFGGTELTAITPDARYTVVRRDSDGYRTTPKLAPMTLQEATEEAMRLQVRYRDQKFVILGEVGEPTKDETVVVRPVGTVGPIEEIAPLLRFPSRFSQRSNA